MKKARDELAVVIREKEPQQIKKKLKQVVLDSLLSPKSKQSSAPNAKKSYDQHLDREAARFFFENAIPFNVASLSSFADMIGKSIFFRRRPALRGVSAC